MRPRNVLPPTLLIAAFLSYASGSPLHRSSNTIAPFYVPPVASHDLFNNSYIVMLKEDVLPSVFSSHLRFLDLVNEESPLQEEGSAGGIAHVYDSIVAKGYAGKFSEEVLGLIRSRPEVKYVEQNQVVRLDNIQMNAPWGLARLGHEYRLAQKDFHYAYEGYGGSGVVVYVLDTGINTDHVEFNGRAQWGGTFFPDEGFEDFQGHGTHVAGTIASSTFGVAKNAIVRAVKVFGVNVPGDASTIIRGIEWAVNDASEIARGSPDTFRGAVINMSLGGGRSRAMDDASDGAVRAGAHVVVSAGNDNKNACDQSPAAAELVITVGASTLEDTKADFSNWGPCVDVHAPGKDILSTWIGRAKATLSLSGTSMSSPHVAGLVAYFLSIYPHWSFNPLLSKADVNRTSETFSPLYPKATGLTPQSLKKALLSLASVGRISGLPSNTPNLLVYNNFTHDMAPTLNEPENFLLHQLYRSGFNV